MKTKYVPPQIKVYHILEPVPLICTSGPFREIENDRNVNLNGISKEADADEACAKRTDFLEDDWEEQDWDI